MYVEDGHEVMVTLTRGGKAHRISVDYETYAHLQNNGAALAKEHEHTVNRPASRGKSDEHKPDKPEQPGREKD